MATLIKSDQTVETLTPASGKSFDLKELQSAVEGYIEPIYLDDGTVLLVNEEALLKPEFALRQNCKATLLMMRHSKLALGGAGYLLGNVLHLTRKELGESDEG